MLIYEGDPVVVPAIKAAFPLAQIQSYQGRAANGDLYYSVQGARALVPDPSQPLHGFFAGEEVTEYKAPAPAPIPEAVKQAEVKAAWVPAPPVVTLKAEPMNAAAKIEQSKAAWKPDPPKRA